MKSGEAMPLDMALPKNLRALYVRAIWAAEYKGVHVETIRRHIKKGKLRADLVGREWMIYRASLAEWEPDTGGNPGWIKD